MRHASPLTEQRRVCSSVGLAAWCGLLAAGAGVTAEGGGYLVPGGRQDNCHRRHHRTAGHRVQPTPGRVDNVNFREKITYTNIQWIFNIYSISYMILLL